MKEIDEFLEELDAGSNINCSNCGKPAKYRKKGGDLWKYKWCFCEKHKGFAKYDEHTIKDLCGD
jgi:hypothetical protein